jgi:uracil-DNA glycosylase
MIKEKLQTLLNYVDRNGKKLSYKPEEGGKIYLDIDNSTRCLGHILIGKESILYTKFEDESNIFRKTNAWSINHTVLVNVDHIHYETRTHDYQITKERALEFGEFMHFQDTTELKVYVPLKYWEKRHKGLQSVYPKEFKHRNAVGDSWYEILKDTMNSDLITNISKFLKQRRTEAVVYPDGDRVFRAFKLCTFEHTKVVILGQDPYHDGTADGLAFSYLHGVKKKHDKSLDLIYIEVERSIYNGLHLDHDYCLEHWARQGVLLLNTCLTVEKGRALSHAATDSSKGIGWERFTKIALYKLLLDIENPKVIMLWGNKAQAHYEEVMQVWNKNMIFQHPHLILKARHPAYDLRVKNTIGHIDPNYPETFSGCNHFKQANEFLKQNSRKEIKW